MSVISFKIDHLLYQFSLKNVDVCRPTVFLFYLFSMYWYYVWTSHAEFLVFNGKGPVDDGGLSMVIYLILRLTMLLITPTLLTITVTSSLFSFHISTHSPLPSSFPAALLHCGIDRKTSPISPWVLGGMYNTDQWFYCPFSPLGSNILLLAVDVHACISASDGHETESLLCIFLPYFSFRWASRKSAISIWSPDSI